MERARGHFLRGCRFCTGAPDLWVEYARCEMEWLAKVEAKKAGKGVRPGVNVMEAIKATESTDLEGDHIAFGDEDSDDEDADDAVLILPDPDVASAGYQAKPKVFDEEATRKLEQSPALGGAIPMAIFDISQKQRFWGAAAAETFFDLFAGFSGVSCQDKIIEHVLGAMKEMFPKDAATCSCVVRQPLIGVAVNTAEFPKALRESLARLKVAMGETEDKKALAKKLVVWIETMLAVEELDEAIKTVLGHTKKLLDEQAQ